MPVNSQYNDLYIYYVKGRVRDGQERFGPLFIGNWQEEDAAFLFFARPADDLVAGVVERDPGLDLVDRYAMS